jgi:predicted metal-dependent phosphoesterase TrpH
MSVNAVPAIINDPRAKPAERLEALERFAAAGGLSHAPEFSGEINNHIHTIYSFSPYTPAMAALKAREAGLEAAGSVDHDSYAAADEMRQACEILHIGCVTGFELRVSFKHTEFAAKKINSPDSLGIAYMTVQGVPAVAAARIKDFLAPLTAARHERNRLMTDKLNKILSAAGLKELSYNSDILPLSMAAEGGSVTERHILYALSLLLIEKAGRGADLLKLLAEKFNLNLSGKIVNLLSDSANPYYDYDLLGALKSSFGTQIFIQPNEKECPPAETVTAFAFSINAVPSYAYLGDVGESPTGDKKAEKFEDDYLDALIPRLKDLGFLGVTYMPPRNTKEQLARLQKLCRSMDLIEISGVDINSPRQSFNCPEIRQSEFAALTNTTWALAAHEKLAALRPEQGLFNPANPMADKNLEERIEAYALIGKKGDYSAL